MVIDGNSWPDFVWNLYSLCLSYRFNTVTGYYFAGYLTSLPDCPASEPLRRTFFSSNNPNCGVPFILPGWSLERFHLRSYKAAIFHFIDRCGFGCRCNSWRITCCYHNLSCTWYAKDGEEELDSAQSSVSWDSRLYFCDLLR